MLVFQKTLEKPHCPFPFSKMLVDELRLAYQLALPRCLFLNAAFTLVMPNTPHVRLDTDSINSSSDD